MTELGHLAVGIGGEAGSEPVGVARWVPAAGQVRWRSVGRQFSQVVAACSLRATTAYVSWSSVVGLNSMYSQSETTSKRWPGGR